MVKFMVNRFSEVRVLEDRSTYFEYGMENRKKAIDETIEILNQLKEIKNKNLKL